MNGYGLLFCAVGDASREQARLLMLLISKLNATRAWAVQPIQPVDETDDASVSAPDDVPIRTLGGFLPLQQGKVARDLDLAQLADVEFLVGELAAFSASTSTELELELDGTYVGDIVDGKVSRLISEGLIGEWRKSLGG